jgi:sulfur-oxidizing protein SoxB
VFSIPACADDGDKHGDKHGTKRITMLQVGDIHGHLIPRPNLRSDGTGGDEGGLSRMYTKIEQIRGKKKNVLLFNTGDTVQGSAEALYTRGQALVDVLDKFDIFGMANGNWDFVYGKERFLELFGPGTGKGPSGTRYGAVAANVYHEGTTDLLLPPYFVKKVNGVKIGVLGLSSERAINALGNWVTEGITFTGDAAEIPGYVAKLKNEEKVDLIVLVSEFGLAKNVLIANANPEINIVLSSDMHEETPQAVVAASGAIVSEVGQDGTQLAQLDLKFYPDNRVASWNFTWHTITMDINPNPRIERLVKRIREKFVSGPGLVPHTNPINGMVLTTPIDSVVGQTTVGLHRSNFSHETLPAVVEGSSADFISDVFRDQAGADIGHFRGFRYGTHIRPGPIKLEDLYHYIAVGPQVGKITITGQQLKNNIEASANGCFNPDVFAWTGGWLNAYGGVRMDLDPYKPTGQRVSNIQVLRATTGLWEPLNTTANYTFAGYWFAQDPQVVGGITTGGAVTVVQGAGGETLDGTQVVANYLAGNVANPEPGRVNLLFPLPAPVYGNPEIQPLLGVPTIH